jgi:hypothetical protein
MPWGLSLPTTWRRQLWDLPSTVTQARDSDSRPRDLHSWSRYGPFSHWLDEKRARYLSTSVLKIQFSTLSYGMTVPTKIEWRWPSQSRGYGERLMKGNPKRACVQERLFAWCYLMTNLSSGLDSIHPILSKQTEMCPFFSQNCWNSDVRIPGAQNGSVLA